MAKYSLKYGPFPLTTAAIDANVSSVKGVYALGPSHPKGGIYVERVGRSDSDVNRRLKWYVGRARYKACTHFMWEPVSSKKLGFEIESELFHEFDPDLNDIHPGRPRGADHCCPVNDKDDCPPCGDED